MDVFITIITWIAGLYAGFMLLMAIGFSAGGAAQTGNSELGIISTVSSVLLMYLIWKGVSSVFFSSEVDVVDVTHSVKESNVEDYDTSSVDVSEVSAPLINTKNTSTHAEVEAVPSQKTIGVKVNESNNYDYILWLFYIIAFISYFSWVFAPSKNRGKGKDLVKKKILASMTLKKDEAGLQAWNPNWRPKEEKESDK